MREQYYRLQLSQNSFFPSTIKLWNNLGVDIRNSPSLNSFKTDIKNQWQPPTLTTSLHHMDPEDLTSYSVVLEIALAVLIMTYSELISLILQTVDVVIPVKTGITFLLFAPYILIYESLFSQNYPGMKATSMLTFFAKVILTFRVMTI